MEGKKVIDGGKEQQTRGVLRETGKPRWVDGSGPAIMKQKNRGWKREILPTKKTLRGKR